MSERPGIHAGHGGEYRACSHPACVEYRTRYHKRWVYERSHGIKRLVDATPARRHIETLIGAGWSYRAIAGAANVSPTTVHRVGRGLQPTLQRPIAQQILDVGGLPQQPTTDADEPFVPKVGTVRRIQALLYMGWRHVDIDPRSGVILSQQGRWVTRSTHDRIAATFTRLAMTPGPSDRTRARARRLGYVGPLDWDDIDFDAAPRTGNTDRRRHRDDVDPVVVERFLAGDHGLPTSKAERVEITRRWVERGGSLNELERATGWKSERYGRNPVRVA